MHSPSRSSTDNCSKMSGRILVSSLFFLLAAVSCGNPSGHRKGGSSAGLSDSGIGPAQPSVPAETELTDGVDRLPMQKEEDVRLFVSLNPVNYKYDGFFEFQTITSFVKSESDSLLVIDSGSEYSLAFESGRRFNIPIEVDYLQRDEIVYPVLNVYFVNNSDRMLNLSFLDVEVATSNLDRRPYFRMSTFLISKCNEMEISNRGYSEEPYLSLEYRILKEGETFDGTYDRKRILPGEGASVDFLDDLVEMGYDYEAVEREVPDCIEEHFDPIYAEDENGDPYMIDVDSSVVHRSVYVGELGMDVVRRLFSPFGVVGYPYASDRVFRYEDELYVLAPIYGRLTCPGSGATFEFQGEICLAHSGIGGAAMDYDDSFDVRLRVQDRGYRIRYPYHATIEPGGSEKVRLTFKCEKSSLHRFRINAVNEEGVPLKSREISMRFFAPKLVRAKLEYTSDHDFEENED